MKKYTCSQELAEIFLKNGFTDITHIKHPKHAFTAFGKGKRTFKPPFKNRKHIEFDYINLISYGLTYSNTSINERDLKALILYNKLNSYCLKVVEMQYGFSIEGMVKFTDDLINKDSYLLKRRPKMAQLATEIYNLITI